MKTKYCYSILRFFYDNSSVAFSPEVKYTFEMTKNGYYPIYKFNNGRQGNKELIICNKEYRFETNQDADDADNGNCCLWYGYSLIIK